MIDLEATLCECALFKGLSEIEIADIAAVCGYERCNRGAVIFYEGQAAASFYIVRSGKIKIYKSNREGKEKILHVCGRGESFAEVPVFDGGNYPATAAALEATELVAISRRRFKELITHKPELSLNILAHFAVKLRRSASQIEDLSLKDVPERVASHIAYLAGANPSLTVVNLGMPKGQLANLLGTTPETLSRVLSRFEEEGLIELSGRDVKIIDHKKLNLAVH
ncbi:Crp/Fnr family transcriptional regulator [Rubellicoccus peritrichatus]|uniref:Crp/Fnr family transcriptional regulator n=1 Tax=Rubellicoccus peritrichatus TaxID=3080537 RepID=A0AAQ3L7E8_9BACT|nr:Crp/Fnr family transcriptional regulator [Puniceicoccus sp. CR14]WOO40655.1 Crp/Fnr family transcriptional regulator [Puniceicoccus sp. CR14]